TAARDHPLIAAHSSITAIRSFLNAIGPNHAGLIVSAHGLPPRVMLLQNAVCSPLNCLPLGLGHRLHSSPAPSPRCRSALPAPPTTSSERSPQQSTPSRSGAGTFAS